MFGHRNAAAPLSVTELTVRSASSGAVAMLALSARHFVPAARNATAAVINTYAKDVQPGDVLTVMAGGQPSAAIVTSTRTALQHGAFNPFTKVPCF